MRQKEKDSRQKEKPQGQKEKDSKQKEKTHDKMSSIPRGQFNSYFFCRAVVVIVFCCEAILFDSLFFNMWVFVRTSTNFAHLTSFQAIEFMD